MKQADLNRAVSRATGETVETIRRLGFLLAEPDDMLDADSPDDGPYMLDWDTLEPQRLEDNTGRSPREMVSV